MRRTSWILSAASVAIASACTMSASSSSGEPPSSGKPAASSVQGKPAEPDGKPVEPAAEPAPEDPAEEPEPQEPGHRAPVDEPAARAKPKPSDVSCSVAPKACKRSSRGAGEACPDERVAELESLCAEALGPLSAADASAFEAQLSRGIRLRQGKNAVVGIDPVKKTIAEAGGPRAFFGLDPKTDLTATVTEDCGRCRRTFVAIELRTPGGPATITLDGTRPPKISALTVPAASSK